jgi:hypothetical protein
MHNVIFLPLIDDILNRIDAFKFILWVFLHLPINHMMKTLALSICHLSVLQQAT